MILNAVLLLMFVVCLAFLWNEGMWSNALSFINTLLAAMVAMNFYEPVADFLEERMASFTYFLDFLSLWLVFALSFTIFRMATDGLSKTRVRFKLPIEVGGRIGFAALTGWVFVCFATTTLHTAPLARNSFRGAFQPTPTAVHFFGLAPDRRWLAFIQQLSRGSLAHVDPSAQSPFPEDEGKRVFDPQAEFIPKYASRRQDLSEEPGLRVRR